MTSPFAADGCPFEVVTRRPRADLREAVQRITGYRELVARHLVQREPASLVVPLIISFGEPFRIGLGRAPTEDDRQASFAAGLFVGPVLIESFGASHCLQVDFTPLGARRFFGMPMRELTDRMLPLDDIFGSVGPALRERLGNMSDWEMRFDLIEGFVAERIAGGREPSPELGEAYRRIGATGGRMRIARLAEHVGWSRKHLVDQFKREIGLGPKSVARLARFGRAVATAQRDPGWAGIAADCGFSDQAHMTREFQALAGMPPTALFPRAA